MFTPSHKSFPKQFFRIRSLFDSFMILILSEKGIHSFVCLSIFSPGKGRKANKEV